MTVDFKEPEGLEILHELITRADVLVENFIPGKLASMVRSLGRGNPHQCMMKHLAFL